MKKVFLLGNTGFIGRYIESAIHSQPQWEYLGASHVSCNLEEASQVARFSQMFTPDSVVIISAGIKRQYGDSFDIFDRNMRMVLNLCAALEQKKPGRMIYLSSAAVYGEDVHNTEIDEQTPIEPKSLYGVGRFASEKLLERLGIPLVVLRPPLVYGCGDRSNGYGPAGFLENIRSKQPITLWGDGSEKREILYVKDLASIVAALIDSPFIGTLNPCSGESRTYADCAEILNSLTGGKCAVSERPRSKAKVDHVFHAARLAQTLPGFRFTPLEKGLAEMIEMEQLR